MGEFGGKLVQVGYQHILKNHILTKGHNSSIVAFGYYTTDGELADKTTA